MKKISRYILVFMTIIAFSVALPKLYWLAFEKPIQAPLVMYSCIDKDFMIQYYDKEFIRTDTKGNIYTRDEFELKQPLFYIRQLLINGTMPDTINGVEMDVHEISRTKSAFRYRPNYKNAPDPGLYPLFESESGRANLEMPLDYFRIKKRMEFVVASDNTVDERKTQMFTTVLNNRGFVFPSKMIAGIPTTRKTIDEGYIVIDDADQMFHVKMIEGEPYVKKVDVPEGLKFKRIECVDNKDRKYYSYLISSTNEVYILTQDDYELIKWPVEDFNPEIEEMRIYGDLFNYTITLKGPNYLNITVLDAEYNKVDEYYDSWESLSETKAGKVAAFIFPAQIKMTDDNSSFVNFYFERSKGFMWLILNVILIIIHFIIIRKTGFKIKRNLIDFAVILITGIYGFLAVNFFQNKFFD